LSTYAYNYREVQIGHVTFGAMAHPVRYAYSAKGTKAKGATPGAYLKKMFNQARAEGYTVMINFDPENSTQMEKIWTKASISKSIMEGLGLSSPKYHYYRFPVRDFHAPEDHVVDALIAIVKSFPANTKIMAHCGEGYGRTGVMLAALQLQTQFDELAADASLADNWGNCKPSKQTAETIIPLGHFARIKQHPGSVQTQTAVTKVRATETGWKKDSHGMAVENEKQARFLNHRCVMLAEEAQQIVAEL